VVKTLGKFSFFGLTGKWAGLLFAYHRTRIKRLVRRTICFSKTERMHDLVIGLFVNP
jgi:IS1 transposase